MRNGEKTLQAAASVSHFGSDSAGAATIPNTTLFRPSNFPDNHSEQTDTCFRTYDIVIPAKAETIYAIRNGGDAYGTMLPVIKGIEFRPRDRAKS